MTDQLKAAKVPKKQTAAKVEAVHADAPEALEPAPAPDPEPAPLTDAERAEAASEVPKAEPVEIKHPPRFRVTAGGYAWCNGQQVRFTTGEEFTTETWEPLMVERFRECGVGIEQIA